MDCDDNEVIDEDCNCVHSNVQVTPSPSANDNVPPSIETPIMENGFDYIGNDLPGSPQTEYNPGDCARLCAFTPGCQYYTFDSCGKQNCWLKRSNAGRQRASCRTSGRATQTPPVWDENEQPPAEVATGPELEEGIGYWGYDLPGSPFVANRPEECARLCASTANCLYYSWDTCTKNQCWLKTSKAGRQVQVCTLSGRGNTNPPAWSGDADVRNPADEGPQLEEGIGYWGYDLPGSPFNVGRPEACAQLCANTAQCLYYSWDTCTKNQCWLKTSKAGRQVQMCTLSGRGNSNPPAWGGEGAPAAPPPPPAEISTPEMEEGVGYWGYDIPGSPFNEASPEGCARMCAFVLGCKYYSWDSCTRNQCWLKTSNAGRMPLTCTVSGRGSTNPPVWNGGAAAPPPPVYIPPTPSDEMEEGIGYWGYDLPGSPFTEYKPEECARLCQYTPGCLYYSWDSCTQNQCWLKTSKEGRMPLACTVSGRGSATPPTWSGISRAEANSGQWSLLSVFLSCL